ncbi:pyridoxamine 5'-phosphate oxidase family protein [Dactylosporangium sp. NPDC005572]|uniref:pyridoxamine 5'-phosphate oxidase family protein n=1 Tax=Dactylosporangium sp. NPDC005572 TaxID=3156889 RepID=UPI0033BE2B2A
MTAEEAYAFLESQRFGVLGTVGPDGAPHMVNVGYLVDDRRIVVTSFAAAQKVKNLERAAVATFLVEIPWPYHQIQGVMITGNTRIVSDVDTVVDVTTRMRAKHAEMSDHQGTPEIDIARHAPRRVAVYIEPVRLRSWDHRRLDGVY